MANSIAEYIPVPADYLIESDFVLQMDSETWGELYLSSVSINDAIDSGKVELRGGKSEIIEIFEMFDKFEPTENYVLPPIED